MTNSTGKCTRCGRTLRSEKSIARGYGPTCERKIRAAAVVITYKPTQVAKALELIADGGIQLLKKNHTRVYRTVSSNGTGQYLTAPMACTCTAGIRGQHVCYHRIAAQLIAA
ncbi:DUF6011 domain-containing protein [Amycolatopsis sp. NPDC051373]|uniref:DUF6011 domain-containing protein n=1 Tax=Amycolatopsis sp. NPDC051373 TaxID=3155801 RepID=UPI003450B5FD